MSRELEAASYVSLATFRKSGVRVATPVWAAFADGAFYVFSAGNAGKVKRLRNSAEAALAVCDVRGKLKGEWHSARAELIDQPQQIEAALRALRNKYGFSMWLADVLASLTGRMKRRVYIRVVLE
jgi:PPOX class probable F420-dependent enzyme